MTDNFKLIKNNLVGFFDPEECLVDNFKPWIRFLNEHPLISNAMSLDAPLKIEPLRLMCTTTIVSEATNSFTFTVQNTQYRVNESVLKTVLNLPTDGFVELPSNNELTQFFISINYQDELHLNRLAKNGCVVEWYLIYITSAFEDVSGEENLHQEQGNSTRIIDLNQPLLSEQVESEGGHTRKNRMLSNAERRSIYLAVLSRSNNGKLRKGTTTEVAIMFSVSTRTVTRIWKQSKTPLANGVVDVSHKKTKNCGRKRVQFDRELFRNIPLPQRTSLESLASAMKMSRSTLHRNVQSGEIRRHTNPIKSLLKDSNKKARVQFCLSMIDKNSIPHNPKFLDMYTTIHIDEKWFYISRNTEKYYLLPEERDPERTCKSKNFLTKVMFLAAIARPRFDSDGNETFSGKIGIFPFTTQEPAKRTSANRVAGTLETKAMTSIGRDIGRSYLIYKVLPAILEKWPREDGNIAIRIQQDNARTHIDPNDEEFRLAVSRLGLNVHLTYQPPNSPDLNVLDLGFFNAIQTLHYKEAANTIDELVVAVENALYSFPSDKSNRIFLTLQHCMIEIMRSRGANSYKLPHMKKASLAKNRRLPIQLQCDPELVEDTTKWLNSNANV